MKLRVPPFVRWLSAFLHRLMGALRAPARSDLPLATREIIGHLQFTSTGVWAWYRLEPQRWAFRSTSDREELLGQVAFRWASLAGHAVRLRVSSQPFDAYAWATALDADTPDPLPDVAGVEETWNRHLARQQERLRTASLDEKVVVLGVRIGDAPKSRVIAALRNGDEQAKDVGALVAVEHQVAEKVAGAGFGARACTPGEMEWLLHRSVAPHVAASPVPDWVSGVWDSSDLPALTDPVEWEATPFGPTVQVTAWRDDVEVVRHVAVVTVSRMEDQRFPENGRSPWMLFADRFGFPVEWSVSGHLVSGKEMIPAAEFNLLRAQNIEKHYRSHDEMPPPAVGRAIAHASEIYDEVAEGAGPMSVRFVGVIRLAVAGSTPEQALSRARAVIDKYGEKLNMELARPRNPSAVLRELIPGEPWDHLGYQRHLPVPYLAAAMPNVSANVGTPKGSYVGYTCGESRRAVLHDGHYPMEVLNKSGLCPVAAEPGGGKSGLEFFLGYSGARRGEPTIVLDPSGPMAALCRLPELAPYSRHLDLANSGEPGTLRPCGLIVDPRRGDFGSRAEWEREVKAARYERKELTLDTFRMLLPHNVQNAPANDEDLSAAVREISGEANGNPWEVVDILVRNGRKDLATMLADAAEMPYGRLIFPDERGPLDVDSGPDSTLVVITMPGVVLPPRDSDPRGWTTQERFARPLLHLAAYFTTRYIYNRPRDERKNVLLDENHFLAEWGSGRALFARLGRDSRKFNAAVVAASQDPADILGMGVEGFIGHAFIGRLTNDKMVRQALELLGVPVGVGYEQVIKGLSPVVNGESQAGEFVYLDCLGRVEKMRVDLEYHAELFAAMNTTPTGRTTSRRFSVIDQENVA